MTHDVPPDEKEGGYVWTEEEALTPNEARLRRTRPTIPQPPRPRRKPRSSPTCF